MLQFNNYPPEPEDIRLTPYIANKLASDAARNADAAVQAIGHAVASFLVEHLPDPTPERVFAAYRNMLQDVRPVDGAQIDFNAGFSWGYHNLTEAAKAEGSNV